MENVKTVFVQVIEEVKAAIEKYNPSVIGYSWDTSSPPHTIRTYWQKRIYRIVINNIGRNFILSYSIIAETTA